MQTPFLLPILLCGAAIVFVVLFEMKNAASLKQLSLRCKWFWCWCHSCNEQSVQDDRDQRHWVICMFSYWSNGDHHHLVILRGPTRSDVITWSTQDCKWLSCVVMWHCIELKPDRSCRAFLPHQRHKALTPASHPDQWP